MRLLLTAAVLFVAACASRSATPAPTLAAGAGTLAPSRQLGSDTDRAAVLAVVRTTFDAMRARDTALMRSVMDSGARLVTTASRDGSPIVRGSDMSSFIRAIGGATVKLDERIFEPEVRITDNLATVLVRYTFRANEQLSHCGYDAFQLARTTTGWKIIAIADTQRREGCTAFEG